MFTDATKLIEKHNIIFKILNKKSNQEARLVGGCVRDFLQMGIVADDIDISTILEPDEIIDLLKEYKNSKDGSNNYNITILDKDKQYGTIVTIFENKQNKQIQKYEITTTRSDIECFGRKANVKFCKSFEQDSKRRDFTINAIYIDVNNKIYDFHNGINDLENNKIVFIGDAEKRIKEDYLRIIRFFRFSTKFDNFKYDEDILEVIKNNKDGLSSISRERIKSEIWKLLEYKNWFIGIKSLKDIDLIESIFLIKQYVIRGNFDDFEANNIVKLFYFFNCDRKIMNELKEKLKFTKSEKNFCDFLTDIWYLTDKGTEFDINAKVKIFIKNNKKYIIDCLPLFKNDISFQINDFLNKMKPLKIKSEDLINLGYNGKELGEKLNMITKLWIESNFKAKEKELLKKIQIYND